MVVAGVFYNKNNDGKLNWVTKYKILSKIKLTYDLQGMKEMDWHPLVFAVNHTDGMVSFVEAAQTSPPNMDGQPRHDVTPTRSQALSSSQRCRLRVMPEIL